MAKKIVTKTTAAPAKKAPASKKAPAETKKAPTPKSSAVEQVCVAALKQLQKLSLDFQLQGEIEWCLASYANDGNPIGLYQMAERALNDFDSIVASQPKAIPAKLIADLRKVLLARP